MIRAKEVWIPCLGRINMIFDLNPEQLRQRYKVALSANLFGQNFKADKMNQYE